MLHWIKFENVNGHTRFVLTHKLGMRKMQRKHKLDMRKKQRKNGDTMFYTIKEFAQMFQVTEHTIRYYTDIGLLLCKRDEKQHRIFDEDSIKQMQEITTLKGCGAAIEDIKDYCQLCREEATAENLQARYDIILRQRMQAYRRVDEAKATAATMDDKVAYYKKLLTEKMEA